MSDKYFDIERDKQFPCFCEACSVGKLESQMSKRDHRYCENCQPVVEEGYAQLRQHKYYLKQLHNQKIQALNSEVVRNHTEKRKEVLAYGKTEKVQLRQNLTEDRPKPNIGGRPRKDVPVDLIHKLFDKGLSVGKIMKELRAQGQIISTRTIQRVLSGQRN